MNDRNGHPLLIGATCVVLRAPVPGYIGRIMRIVSINTKLTECVMLEADSLTPVAVRPTWITVTQDPPIKQRLATPRTLAVQRDREQITLLLARYPDGLTTTDLRNALRIAAGISLKPTHLMHRLKELMQDRQVHRVDVNTPRASPRSSPRHLYRLAAPTAPTT